MKTLVVLPFMFVLALPITLLLLRIFFRAKRDKEFSRVMFLWVLISFLAWVLYGGAWSEHLYCEEVLFYIRLFPFWIFCVVKLYFLAFVISWCVKKVFNTSRKAQRQVFSWVYCVLMTVPNISIYAAIFRLLV